MSKPKTVSQIIKPNKGKVIKFSFFMLSYGYITGIHIAFAPLVCPFLCLSLFLKVWSVCLTPRSRSSVKVNVKYQGHNFRKMAVLGTFVFNKHIFVLLF